MGYCIVKVDSDKKHFKYLKNKENISNQYKFDIGKEGALIYSKLLKARNVAHYACKAIGVDCTDVQIVNVVYDAEKNIDEKFFNDDHIIKNWWNLEDSKIVEIDSNFIKSSLESAAKCDKTYVEVNSTESTHSYVTEDSKSFLSDFLEDYLKEIGKKEAISESLSEKDRIIVDLLHAIEFKKANVVEGYRLFKELHDTLVERRKYKDRIQKLQLFESKFTKEDAETLLKKLNSFEDRVYTPRVLFDLFLKSDES